MLNGIQLLFAEKRELCGRKDQRRTSHNAGSFSVRVDYQLNPAPLRPTLREKMDLCISTIGPPPCIKWI
jgi:hypothetical protein